jgi:hypothetical protein
MEKFYEVVYYYFYGRLKYPKWIYSEKLGYFSHLENCEKSIKKYINKNNSLNSGLKISDQTSIVSFRVYEYILNQKGNPYKEYIYSLSGDFKGNAIVIPHRKFQGVPEEKCQYKIRDKVSFIDYRFLRKGVISHLPLLKKFVNALAKSKKKGLMPDQGDNVYTIIYGKNNEDHLHIPECEIISIYYDFPNHKISDS